MKRISIIIIAVCGLLATAWATENIYMVDGKIAVMNGRVQFSRWLLNFDGTTTDYVDLNDSIQLTASSNFSVCAWVKRVATGTRDIIIGNYTGTTNQMLLSSAADGKFRLNITAGGDKDYRTTSIISTNVWYFLATTYAGSGQNLQLYIDGTTQAVTKVTDELLAGNIHSGTPFKIGKDNRADPTSVMFGGNIAEVSFWNKTLSLADIQSCMYNSLSGSESGLIGYWRMNEGTGTNANDSSASDYDGNIYGTTWTRGGILK